MPNFTLGDYELIQAYVPETDVLTIPEAFDLARARDEQAAFDLFMDTQSPNEGEKETCLDLEAAMDVMRQEPPEKLTREQQIMVELGYSV